MLLLACCKSVAYAGFGQQENRAGGVLFDFVTESGDVDAEVVHVGFGGWAPEGAEYVAMGENSVAMPTDLEGTTT